MKLLCNSMAINSLLSSSSAATSTSNVEETTFCHSADTAASMKDESEMTSQQVVRTTSSVPAVAAAAGEVDDLVIVVPSEIKEVTAKYRWYRSLKTHSDSVFLILPFNKVRLSGFFDFRFSRNDNACEIRAYRSLTRCRVTVVQRNGHSYGYTTSNILKPLCSGRRFWGRT